MAMPEKEAQMRVLRVAELNAVVKNLLEGSLPLLWVRGEVSNLVRAASGHSYFSLKDEQAQVRCVMFRQRAVGLDRPLSNGMQLEIRALATLYEARGDYQLMVEEVRPAGLGLLFEQFERLKARLAAEGLFAAERKRALPRFPRRVGVVTSPQAAALRDVLTTLRRRLPAVPVLLYPTPVQGAGSAEKIAQAIQRASERAECDVLIVCRGGGSLEDLWSFNEEVVARAIAACRVPVISGVGHETDFTIADFVADERAPTPTAAAQRVVPDRQALLQQVAHLAQRMQRQFWQQHARLGQTLDYAQRRLVHPAQALQRQGQQLTQLQIRLRRALAEQQRARRQTLHMLTQRWQVPRQRERAAQVEAWAGRLQRAWQHRQRHASLQLTHAAQQLHLLDPQQVLTRGYALVRDEHGRLVQRSTQLAPGMGLQLQLAQGRAAARVTAVLHDENLPKENNT